MENMRRTSSTIPFGYKLNEDNNELLETIPEQLEALDKIIPMIKNKTILLKSCFNRTSGHSIP